MNGGTRPQACPFVAFDDERDQRSEAPDPRHRCFAVPNPEPRAIAHQQAYCLTPNFPSCAFFMDWAARAAAAPLAGSGMGFGAAPIPRSGYGAYGAPGGHAGGQGGQVPEMESPGAADPVGRPWAAPPPWVGDPELRATEAAAQAWTPPPPLPVQPWRPPPPQVPHAWTPPPAPVSASFSPPPAPPVSTEPEQLMALPEPDEPEADRDYDLSGDMPLPTVNRAALTRPEVGAYNPDSGILPVPSEAYPGDDSAGVERVQLLAPLPPMTPLASAAPPMVPAPQVLPSLPAPGGGLSSAPLVALPPASAAALGARMDPAAPIPPYAPTGPEAWSHPVAPYGSMPDDVDPGGTPQQAEARSRLTGRPIDAGGPPRFSPQARQPLKKKNDGEWSKPRRFEAYPTLGGRMRGLSPILVGAFAIALVALLLFLLPGFLGGGGPAPTRTPAAATATPVPTATPEPTPESYTIKGGDTLGVVAKSLGRTIEQMACFNNLKNVNSLSIGQVLLVPPADYVCPTKPSPTKK